MKIKAIVDRSSLPVLFAAQSVRRQPVRQYTAPATQSNVSEQPQPLPFESVPGLSSLPIIGPMHHFLPVIGKIGPPENFAAMLKVFHEEFGPVVKMGGVFRRADMLILFEPEHFEQVYRTEEVTPLRPGFESLTYYKDVMRKDIFEGVHGLTTAQGQSWREFRTKVNPALLKPKVVKLYTLGLEEIANEMTARLTKLPSDYIRENFEVEMTKFSLECMGLVGLGDRLGCLQDDLAEDHPARKLMTCGGQIVDLAFKAEMVSILWRYFNTPTFKKLVNALDTQWEISSQYIEKARQKIDQRGHDVPEEEKSIIEKLLAIDEKVAVMMANEMLMAGIDTVAFTTTVILYKLATNLEVQSKLREEIRSGDPKQRYLKACLKESLRMQPVVSSNLRMVSKDHIVAGYHIPKGVHVVAPNEYLSKLEKYYPRPLEFIPERWLVDKTDPLYYGNAHPMVTLPFGFGVRSCIGRRIAELEIELFIQKLVEGHEITWDGPPMKIKTMIINKIQKPYFFKFKKI